MNIPEGATHWDKDKQKFSNAVADTGRFRPLSDDLTWLALRCDNWVDSRTVQNIRRDEDSDRQYHFDPDLRIGYTYNQWLTRRRELGLERPEVTPDEDAAWEEERERRQGDRRGEFGSTVIQYNPDDVAFNVQHDPVNRPAHYASGDIERRQASSNPPPSKYHRMINGEWTDVYDVLIAFEVTNPADQHAIKKMLLPGLRGAKDGIQDRREAIQSLERAIKIEQELHDSHL